MHKGTDQLALPRNLTRTSVSFTGLIVIIIIIKISIFINEVSVGVMNKHSIQIIKVK